MDKVVKTKLNINRILTEEEVQIILKAVKPNMNHYLMLGLLYSCGLTLNELVNIKVDDINLKEMSLIIHGGKNLRKRTFSIPEFFRFYVEYNYYGKKKGDFLFKGKRGNIHRRTVQKIFDTVYKKTGIQISPHTLRRSIAVHLYQIGWSKLSIREFLGHNQYQSTHNILRGIPEPKPGRHPIQNMDLNLGNSA